VPEAHSGAAAYWRSLGAQVVAAAVAPQPGPAHLNLPFREPLLPSGATVDLGVGSSGRPAGRPWHSVSTPQEMPSERDVAALARLISSVERGVLVAGGVRSPLGGRAVELAAAAGWPVLAEPTSGLRVPAVACAAGTLLVTNEAFRAEHTPDLVLQIGAAPTARSILALVGEAKRLVVVDPDGVIADPLRKAEWTIRCSADMLACELTRAVDSRGMTHWLDAWQRADAVVRHAVDTLIDSWDEPFEGRVARDVAAVLPDGAQLLVASSMPVRDLDAFMAPRKGLRVIANRGASGIDGTVSTAAGVATGSGVPTWALIGDLALLHDASALLWTGAQVSNLTLVVLNNGGGGIFAMLPQAGLDAPERDLFETPHQVDIASLATAAGIAHRRVERGSGVARAALEEQTGRMGLVEVCTDRARNAEQHAAVTAAVSRAVVALRR
jgi:2-succinyl-5-enolpyruvyl-6-hydroxy-3-cyclohexene-1-carboxylate synthase